MSLPSSARGDYAPFIEGYQYRIGAKRIEGERETGLMQAALHSTDLLRSFGPEFAKQGLFAAHSAARHAQEMLETLNETLMEHSNQVDMNEPIVPLKGRPPSGGEWT